MNDNTNPLPRWVPWAAAVVIFAGFGALEALDAHTERLIAQADAQAAQAVAQVARQYGIECNPAPAVIAQVQQ